MNKRVLNFGIFGGKKQREESDATELVSELDKSIVSPPDRSVKIPASSLRSSLPMMKNGMATVEFSSLSNNNKAVIGVAKAEEGVSKHSDRSGSVVTESGNVILKPNDRGGSAVTESENGVSKPSDNSGSVPVVRNLTETGVSKPSDNSGSVPVQVVPQQPENSGSVTVSINTAKPTVDTQDSGSVVVNIATADSTGDTTKTDTTKELESQSDDINKDTVDAQTEDSTSTAEVPENDTVDNCNTAPTQAEVPENDIVDNCNTAPTQTEAEDGVDDSIMPTADDLFSTFETLPEGLRRALVDRVISNYPELFDGVEDTCVTFEDEETPQGNTSDNDYDSYTLTDMFCSTPILDRKELLINMFSQFDDLLNYLTTYDSEIEKQLSEIKEQKSILVDQISDDTSDEDLAKTMSDIRDLMRSIKEVESMKDTVKELVNKYSK